MKIITGTTNDFKASISLHSVVIFTVSVIILILLILTHNAFDESRLKIEECERTLTANTRCEIVAHKVAIPMTSPP